MKIAVKVAQTLLIQAAKRSFKWKHILLAAYFQNQHQCLSSHKTTRAQYRNLETKTAKEGGEERITQKNHTVSIFPFTCFWGGPYFYELYGISPPYPSLQVQGQADVQELLIKLDYAGASTC